MKTEATYYQVERHYQSGPNGSEKQWVPLDLNNTRLTEAEARERATAMVPNQWTDAYRVVRVTEVRTVEVI